MYKLRLPHIISQIVTWVIELFKILTNLSSQPANLASNSEEDVWQHFSTV